MATFQTYACGGCEDFHAPLIEEGEDLLPRVLSTEQRRKFVCETHFSTPLVA